MTALPNNTMEVEGDQRKPGKEIGERNMVTACFRYSLRKMEAAASELNGDKWSMTYAALTVTRHKSIKLKVCSMILQS